MGNTIILSIVRYTRKSIELVAIAYIIDKIFKKLEILIELFNLKVIVLIFEYY